MLAPSSLDVTLAGTPLFKWGKEDVAIESRKPLAMLCFLCMQRAGCERDRLAELLWGPERLLNVRQALYQLRQLPGAEQWLDVGELITVRADTDVGRFERAVEREDYGAALEHWAPPLLSGVPFPRVATFREWLELERSRLEGLYLRALEHRAGDLERDGAFEQALEMVMNYLSADPLRETAYRSAMRLNYLLGDPETSIDMYRECRGVLRKELDSEPLPATVALAESIARGEPLSLAVSPRHLPSGLLRLLQTVVVGGGRLSVHELARALGRDDFEVAEGLVELGRRRLLMPGGELPEQVAEETLANLAQPLLRVLHRRIAMSLEDEAFEGAEESIGRHWLAAGEAYSAARWLLAALRAAIDAHDEQKAALTGFRVLWCGDSRQRFEAALLLEGSCERTGDGELQDALLEVAHDVAWELQDDHALARLGLRRARRHLRLKAPAAALPLAQEALAVARRLADQDLLARALNAVGGVHFHLGQLKEAQSSFAENRSAESAGERYRALNNLGAVAGTQGDMAGAYRYAEEALTLARQQQNVDDVAACLNNLAATAERMATYGRAVTRLREGRTLARRTGNVRLAVQLLVNLAQVYSKQGALGPGWNTAEEALSESLELEDARLAGQALEQLGQIARLAGDLVEADRRFLQAEQHFEDAGDERKLATVRCNVAVTRFTCGEAGFADEVEARLSGLDELRLGELGRWFSAELAVASQSPTQVRYWLKRALDGPPNPHLTLLTTIGALRADLLENAAEAEAPDGLEAGLNELEVVEAPLGYLLLSLARPVGEEDGHLRRAEQLLYEQGEGLPRGLRQSHSQQNERWRSALGF